MAKVIEQCQVAPPPGGAAELTLPLTYFDLTWLIFGRNRRTLFYKLPISKLDFVQTIIPRLKDSLSLTLKHYTPLAGNLVCPIDSSGHPELRYVPGDSVCVTFSETDMDFNYLIGNHPRNAKDFYPLIPQLAEPKDAPGVILAPLLAIKVTLFPNLGISIGFSNHHAACDGNTIVRFTRAWALLNKFDGDEQSIANEFIPFYGRSAIKDPNEQGTTMWNIIKTFKPEMRDIVMIPVDKVRATFILGHDKIVKLKNLVLSRRPSLEHVTSFTITCAYVWTCYVKSKATVWEEKDKNVLEFFICAVDYRARLNPPLPQSYFGNCIIGYNSETTHINLIGEEGFTIAAELIGKTIQKRLKDEDWLHSGNWFKSFDTVDHKRAFGLTGSPKFDLYATDFGWGKPAKLESISIENGEGGAMSLSKSRDSDGDLEIGLSLSKAQMNAFASIFSHGLSFV
ncbi:phenolic glucoside malonyltransferase 1-like [Capsicum chacoense]